MGLGGTHSHESPATCVFGGWGGPEGVEVALGQEQVGLLGWSKMDL